MKTAERTAPALEGYRTVTLLDTERGGVNRWLVVGTDGAPCVVMAPDEQWAQDAGYRLRFWAEADNSRRLSGRGTAPVKDISAARAEVPWVAYDCFPALPLATAVATHEGPLPAETVARLGVVLAEAVLSAHRQGLVHAGISPRSVLLTRQGPLLTGYGLVRAACAEGVGRHAVPGVDEESLPPEQRAGDRPQPAGDVYALASVLLFAQRAGTPSGGPAPAAEGKTAPCLERCLATDPARRPRVEELLDALRAALPGTGGGLPDGIVAALDRQRTSLPPPPPPGTTADPADAGTAPGKTKPPRRSGTSASSPTRRALLTASATAAAGAVLGATGVTSWRHFGSTERAHDDGGLFRLAPAPLWRHPLPRKKSSLKVSLLVGKRLLVSREKGLFAVDVHNGKQLWSRDDVTASQLLRVGQDDVLVGSGEGGGGFSLLSTRSGKVKWHEDSYVDSPTMEYVLALENGTVWCFTEDYGEADGDDPAQGVIAYDLRRRKELWRTRLPKSFLSTWGEPRPGAPGAALAGSKLLIANTGKNVQEKGVTYLALDRRNGKRQWKKKYPEATGGEDDLALPVGKDLLLAGTDDGLRGMSLTSGKERWTVPTDGRVPSRHAIRKQTVYVTDAKSSTYAVDIESGKVRWKRKRANSVSAPGGIRRMALSASGRTLIRSDLSEIDALDTRDGSLRWRLAVVGTGKDPELTGAVVAGTTGLVVVDNDSSIYALPVD